MRFDFMDEKQTETPDSTAVRVALWRALHVEIDIGRTDGLRPSSGGRS
jgi:hypothetical protein